MFLNSKIKSFEVIQVNKLKTIIYITFIFIFLNSELKI